MPLPRLKAPGLSPVVSFVRVSHRIIAILAVVFFIHESLVVVLLTNVAKQGGVHTSSRHVVTTGCGERRRNLPDVLVFRRSKHTGSAVMLAAISKVVSPLGYVALYHSPNVMLDMVRAEGLKPVPRRLFVAQHNQVTRDAVGGTRTIIADTVADGYHQVMGYCRQFEHVLGCGVDMVNCLEGDSAQGLANYRWAARSGEDDATFIDLPLSAAHPALSTKVFRHVFEDATLKVARLNGSESNCRDSVQLRRVYDKHFKALDMQVDMLRKRILVMAGYPASAQQKFNITLREMLNKAEALEQDSGKTLQANLAGIRKGVPNAVEGLQLGEWERVASAGIRLKQKGR